MREATSNIKYNCCNEMYFGVLFWKCGVHVFLTAFLVFFFPYQLLDFWHLIIIALLQICCLSSSDPVLSWIKDHLLRQI